MVGFLLNLPPVALSFSIIQVAIYLTSNYYISSEEDVWVSWVKVVDKLQMWRILIAHYFHFKKVNLFWTVVTLMTIGRCLEKKLTKTAVVILINLNGIVSNGLFLYLGMFILPPPEGSKFSENSYGFTCLTFGLRVILAYIHEPRNYEASFLYGLFPRVLPANWAPWQPFLEIIVLKICLKESCVAYPIASTLSGLFLSHVIRLFPQEWVFLSTPVYENNEDSNSKDFSDAVFPVLSAEVLRAIRTNQPTIINCYTNQNGVIRYSFPQQDAHLNHSLRFQLLLHQQLYRQARKRGGKRPD